MNTTNQQVIPYEDNRISELDRLKILQKIETYKMNYPDMDLVSTVRNMNEIITIHKNNPTYKELIYFLNGKCIVGNIIDEIDKYLLESLRRVNYDCEITINDIYKTITYELIPIPECA